MTKALIILALMASIGGAIVVIETPGFLPAVRQRWIDLR